MVRIHLCKSISSQGALHASNIRYLDRNMGMVFIIWDRLFGTFQPELAEDPVKYGLTKQLKNPNHLTKNNFS